MGICGIKDRARFTRARLGRGSPTALSKLESRGRRDPMIATIKHELSSMVPSVDPPGVGYVVERGEALVQERKYLLTSPHTTPPNLPT